MIHEAALGGFLALRPKARAIVDLAFAELCNLKNDAGDNILKIAIDAGICGAEFAGALFQCDDSFITDAEAWTIINHAMAGVLEHTLHCIDRSAGLASTADLPNVSEYREDL